MSYVKQKTWQAVDSLVSPSAIQVRLAFALQHLVVLQSHLEHERPSDLTPKVASIVERLSRSLIHEKDRSRVTLDDEQAGKIAEEILSLYVEANGGLG